jgi:hypothetical protein
MVSSLPLLNIFWTLSGKDGDWLWTFARCSKMVNAPLENI